MHPLPRRRRSPLHHLITFGAIGAFVAACSGTDRVVAPDVAPDINRSESEGLRGKMVFHSSRDGDADIYVMNADGSNQTRLTSTTDWDFDPTWSPDGKRIAFNRYPPDFSRCEIYVMNADGSDLTQLTHDGLYTWGSIWSPDGKRIAFGSYRDDGQDNIYIMNADGSNIKRLTTLAYVAAVTAWSPNGKQLAFLSYRDYVEQGQAGDLEIYTVDVATGTHFTQLTDNHVSDEGDRAGWSPNGKLFTFSSRRDGGDLDIFIMNADGSHVRQVTGIGGDGTVDDDDSYWSPDGKYLSYQSTRDGDEEVYTSRLDGSDVRQLTFNVGAFDAVANWVSGKIKSAKEDTDDDEGEDDDR